VSVDESTRTVVRIMMPWQDQREERWLAEQARSGWQLRAVHLLGYTLERVQPAEVAYRLDFLPRRGHDREEYLGLFQDAGWEYVGKRGFWQFFRKPVLDGVVPQIYTDPQSRIAMYRRVVGLLGMLLALMISQTAPRLSLPPRAGSALNPIILTIQTALIVLFSYGIVRLLLVISGLKRARPTDLR
jgi:hypothetical protein